MLNSKWFWGKTLWFVANSIRVLSPKTEYYPQISPASPVSSGINRLWCSFLHPESSVLPLLAILVLSVILRFSVSHLRVGIKRWVVGQPFLMPPPPTLSPFVFVLESQDLTLQTVSSTSHINVVLFFCFIHVCPSNKGLPVAHFHAYRAFRKCLGL